MKKKERKRFKNFFEGKEERINKKVKPYKRKKIKKNLNDYLDSYES
jgi:hypothetical protein